MILGDGALGQMMEPAVLPETNQQVTDKPWAACGLKGRRKPNIINSLYLDPNRLEQHNLHLQHKYQLIEQSEVRYEEYHTEDAELIIIAYGITSRIARTAIEKARNAGRRIGMLRPITLWPFPSRAIRELAQKTKAFLALELSAGQMVEDVKLAVNGARPVYFYGRMGGVIPSTQELYEQMIQVISGEGGKGDD